MAVILLLAALNDPSAAPSPSTSDPWWDEPPPAVVHTPTPRVFRRTGWGILAESTAGSAVALSSALLFDRLRASDMEPFQRIFVFPVVLSGTTFATGGSAGIAGWLVDGPRYDWTVVVGPAVGMGAGLVAGFSVVEGIPGEDGAGSATPIIMLGVVLGTVVGYNMAADADADLPGASTRVRRKLALSGVVGGNTVNGAGLDIGFQLSDRVGTTLQLKQGLNGIDAVEASFRLQLTPLGGLHHGFFGAAGPHLTAGRDRLALTPLEKPRASMGAIAAVGWEFRGEGGFTFGVELSGVYEPDARNIEEVERQGPFYPGGAIRFGYAR